MSLVTRGRRLAVDAGQSARRLDPGLAYFNSFQGRYSDSPRAIAQELAGGSIDQVWRADDPHAGAFPAGARTVRGGTWDHVRAIGSARWVVTNDWMVSHPKRRGQTWLQTWHGTPLKRLALDRGLSPEQERSIAREVRKWDYLVSPNPFSTEVFRGAFGYEGAVLETGYPRNDVLSRPDAAETRDRVRQELGIPSDHTAVLYAPTWRDRVVTADDSEGFSLTLDVDAFSAALSGNHTLLLRLHHYIAGRFANVSTPSCVNVSGHADISDLYLAADVLVTDYSSAMFDFAVTRKPILFLAPDLERYRDEMRGFYFDFEADAPGPILRRTDELLQALADPAGTDAAYAPAYERFRDRFCALEDGHAARRVVEAVFGEEAS